MPCQMSNITGKLWDSKINAFLNLSVCTEESAAGEINGELGDCMNQFFLVRWLISVLV